MIKLNKVSKIITIETFALLANKKEVPLFITIDKDTPVSMNEKGNAVIFKNGEQFIIKETYDEVRNLLIEVL